jgi:hypothetical protein
VDQILEDLGHPEDTLGVDGPGPVLKYEHAGWFAGIVLSRHKDPIVPDGILENFAVEQKGTFESSLGNAFLGEGIRSEWITDGRPLPATPPAALSTLPVLGSGIALRVVLLCGRTILGHGFIRNGPGSYPTKKANAKNNNTHGVDPRLIPCAGDGCDR